MVIVSGCFSPAPVHVAVKAMKYEFVSVVAWFVDMDGRFHRVYDILGDFGVYARHLLTDSICQSAINVDQSVSSTLLALLHTFLPLLVMCQK